MISVIKTDNEAAWSIGWVEWQNMIKDLGIRIAYVEPGARHADENGYAENAVQNVELAMKSIMVAHALPAAWWQAVCADVEILLNRFPSASDDIALPLDGDRALRTGNTPPGGVGLGR